MTALKICPSMAEFEALKNRVDLIGGFYSASWTATSTNANNVPLTTETVTLPAGTYLVQVRFPRVNNDNFYWADLRGGMVENSYFRGTTGGRYAVVIPVSEGSKLRLYSAQSGSATFSNTSEGQLRAVRLTV